MEDMLTRQIKLTDKFRETMEVASQKIITTKSCLVVMGDKRTELMEENEAWKKKVAEYEAKALADEDPKELTLYNTDGQEITVEEWEERAVRKVKEARAARLESKRRKIVPLACLTRIKRR
jgi:plastocyanin domain-containing protein